MWGVKEVKRSGEKCRSWEEIIFVGKLRSNFEFFKINKGIILNFYLSINDFGFFYKLGIFGF